MVVMIWGMSARACVVGGEGQVGEGVLQQLFVHRNLLSGGDGLVVALFYPIAGTGGSENDE